MFNTLADFYRSSEWEDFRKIIIAQRTHADGFVYDEITNKPIVIAGDIIIHHKIPLTLDNVNDFNISLNPDNVQIVSFKTHNDIHDRFGTYTRHVYLIYGCPLSGKSTFVKERANIHDLIIDIDRIYECISNNPPYMKSGRLYDNVQAVREALLDCIKFKRGKWVNAFIISGAPLKRDREMYETVYGAEPIYIDCDKETALNRLASCEDGRDVKEWQKYIETWFSRYQE
jgi:hypothetical protein